MDLKKVTFVCFNPLKKMNHKVYKTRYVSKTLVSKFPTLSKQLRICSTCRKELNKLEELPTSNPLECEEPCDGVDVPDDDGSIIRKFM